MIRIRKIQEGLKKIATIAGVLSNNGWAEANAGNISLNVSDALEDEFDSSDHQRPSEDYCFSKDTSIIITSSGSRMREIAEAPEKFCGVLTFVAGKKGYFISKFGQDEFIPTSEYPSHIGIHRYLVNSERSEKAVVHSHPDELIAAMHKEELNSEKSINSVFEKMHSEFSMLMPDKVGFIPFTDPGSKDLANRTLEKLHKHKIVLWKDHGCISIGNNLDSALDNIEIVNKIAKVYLMQK
ncbi:MAG: rhamnulose-1-phosphate aldolase [Candidatus Delongbacteria bacterium]|nr:rhamnulose-1-phosphate aldolase [Candidatus Delongbacteria bacterium]